ncbi:hypothetical protein JNK13_10345 [bacterium]|nr:hypothetical protein [bacterium]
MDKKKVVDIVLMKPAFSMRNLTSLLLVAFFFGVYAMAGGKVTSIPRVKTGGEFGTVRSTPNLDSGTQAVVTDNKKPADRALVIETSAPGSAATTQPTSTQDPAGIRKPEPGDALSDIEARLNRIQPSGTNR